MNEYGEYYNNENDYSDSDSYDSEEDYDQSVPITREQKKLYAEYKMNKKQNQKRTHRYMHPTKKLLLPKDNNPDKKKKVPFIIKYYSSGGVPGSCIRWATTGDKSNYTVGSKDQEEFFIVTVATGTNYGSVRAYFESPEEYERHFSSTLNRHTKERWYRARPHLRGAQTADQFVRNQEAPVRFTTIK